MNRKFSKVQENTRSNISSQVGNLFKFKEEFFESPGENLIGNNLSGGKPVRAARPPTKSSGYRLFRATCENSLQLNMTRNHFFLFFQFSHFCEFCRVFWLFAVRSHFCGVYCSSALRKNHMQINVIHNHFSLKCGACAPKPAQSIKKRCGSNDVGQCSVLGALVR